jgi:hypothetical protein
MTVDAKLMAVVAAIKQSIETSGTPGLSVNNHPNPFLLNVIGSIDLQRAAEHVLARLEAYDENVKAKFVADVKKVADKLRAEFTAGAVNIEDAFARIYAKGELLVTAGASAAASAMVELERAVAAGQLQQTKEADAATRASAVDGH